MIESRIPDRPRGMTLTHCDHLRGCPGRARSDYIVMLSPFLITHSSCASLRRLQPSPHLSCHTQTCSPHTHVVLIVLHSLSPLPSLGLHFAVFPSICVYMCVRVCVGSPPRRITGVQTQHGQPGRDAPHAYLHARPLPRYVRAPCHNPRVDRIINQSSLDST